MMGISVAIPVRDIGLRAAKLLECGLGGRGLSGHARRGGDDLVVADVIFALADGLARSRITSSRLRPTNCP